MVLALMPARSARSALAISLSLSLSACGSGEGATRSEGAKQPAPVSPTSPASAAAAAPSAEDAAAGKPDDAGFSEFAPGEAPVELGGLKLAFEPMAWDPWRRDYLALGGTATVTVTKPVKNLDSVVFKAACESGGALLVSSSSLLLGELEPGAPHQDEPSLFENEYLKVAPERCEITVLFDKTMSTTERPRLLETRCLEGGELRRGSCERLERPEPGDEAVALVGVPKITIRRLPEEIGFVYSLWLRRGRGLPDTAAPVSAALKCTVRGETEEQEYGGPTMWRYALPGETIVDSALLTFAGGAAAPSECDMRFAVEPLMEEPRPLGRFCYEDGETRAGACD